MPKAARRPKAEQKKGSAKKAAASTLERVDAALAERAAGGPRHRALVQVLAALRAELADLTEVWQTPRRLDVERQIRDAEAGVEDIASGAALRRMTTKREQYLAAAAKVPSDADAKQRAIAHSTDAASTLAAASSAILNEAPSTILVAPVDECGACHTQLQASAEDAVLVCPTCHVTQKYVMYTSGNRGESGGADDAAPSTQAANKTPLSDFLDIVQGNERARPDVPTLLEVGREILRAGVRSELSALTDVGVQAAVAAARLKGARFSSLSDLHNRAPNGALQKALRAVTAKDVRDAAARLIARRSAPHGAAQDADRVADSARIAELERISEHAFKSAAMLSGLAPRRLPADVVAQLVAMFASASQSNIMRGARSVGKAMFFRRALLLLGLDEFLLDADADDEADDKVERFRKLCAELDWEFVSAPAPAMAPS